MPSRNGERPSHCTVGSTRLINRVVPSAFAYVGAFTAHVNVGFFHGAALPDPAGLLEGTGKYMRHVKVKPGIALDGSSLEALIVAAYRDIVERLRVAE